MSEEDDLLHRFLGELRKTTADGQDKRGRGDKLPWYVDQTHEASVFSHLMKWKRGEIIDPDSGAHTLVHAAWRLLAIACQETQNTPLHTGNGADQQGSPARTDSEGSMAR